MVSVSVYKYIARVTKYTELHAQSVSFVSHLNKDSTVA